jgi:hypothetical protein
MSEPLLSIEDFKPYLNQMLQIRFTPEVSLAAKLTEVTPLNSYAVAPRAAFAIAFCADFKNGYYAQGTFQLLHPVKGPLDLFMVPTGPSPDGIRYEAIFT